MYSKMMKISLDAPKIYLYVYFYTFSYMFLKLLQKFKDVMITSFSLPA